MTPRLHVVTDYDDTPDEAPTRPGDFETPGGLPQETRVVHRIVCPHHSLPWTKLIAVGAAVAAVVTLALRGLLH